MTQKAALVTGGAQGIGLAIARLLSRRGYRVAVADLEAGKREGFLFVRTDAGCFPTRPASSPARTSSSTAG